MTVDTRVTRGPAESSARAPHEDLHLQLDHHWIVRFSRAGITHAILARAKGDPLKRIRVVLAKMPLLMHDILQHVVAAQPDMAVVGVIDVINQPRYPSLRGIMAAKRKPVETWTVADLGLDPATVGLQGARTRVVNVEKPPARTAGEVYEDKGDAAQRIVEFLIARKVL